MTTYVTLTEDGTAVTNIFAQQQTAIAYVAYVAPRPVIPAVEAVEGHAAVYDNDGNLLAAAIEEVIGSPEVPAVLEVQQVDGRELPTGYAEIADDDPRLAAYHALNDLVYVTRDSTGKIDAVLGGPQAEPTPTGYDSVASNATELATFYADLQAALNPPAPVTPTKDQLLAALQTIQAQIQALS